jgi:hypothetical protein
MKIKNRDYVKGESQCIKHEYVMMTIQPQIRVSFSNPVSAQEISPIAT